MKPDASGRSMWRQSTSTNILHCQCKTQNANAFTQLQSYKHNIFHLKTLIIQSDSSLPQFLDREDSSVQKFTFNVQPSINNCKCTSNTHLHLLSNIPQPCFSSKTFSRRSLKKKKEKKGRILDSNNSKQFQKAPDLHSAGESRRGLCSSSNKRGKTGFQLLSVSKGETRRGGWGESFR